MRKTSQITPEHIYLSRRRFLKGVGLIAGAVALNACTGQASGDGRQRFTPMPTATSIPPANRQMVDEFGDPATPLEKIRSFGNYYEFTRSKVDIQEAAANLVTSPWQVEVGGLVNKPQVFDLDDLLALGQEERIYRMRCMEAWSMVIPWTGFPLAKLLQRVEPTSAAKFVRFESLFDPAQMPGQRPGAYADGSHSAPANTPEPGEVAQNQMGASPDTPYVWPYAEGLRLDEAMHPLTLLATGIYGKPLYPENGAPIRLVVPWKYAFKSVKAIVKIELVTEMPTSFWMAAMPTEHGFYANVNPDVPHPRWSQGREFRYLGLDPEPVIPTLKFNGYAADVAQLYTGMDLAKNF